MDIHPTWSGPCEMMFPTYQDLSSTIDDFDKRLDFIMVYQNKRQIFKISFEKIASSREIQKS